MKAQVKSSESSLHGGSTPSRAEITKSLDDGLFELIGEHRHEQVSIWHDPDAGYRGIIAIHNTTLGPALGGTRMWTYENDLEALIDVLRLSRGMTYKAAVAGLNLGGGKSVIVGDPNETDRGPIFRAHGRHVQSLSGRYITAEDVGTSTSDMEFIREETEYVVGLAGRSGDPSPMTALGVYRGMKACAQVAYGSDSLAGKTVTVQGCGHVGYYLCKHLYEEGAKLVVSDIDDRKVKQVVDEFRATGVAPDDIYAVDADIFAPCALGAVVNDDSITLLKVDIVAGAANNQLDEERHGDALHERGIIYAPDYAINAGGLINVNAEVEGWDLERSRQKASEIYATILRVLQIASDAGIPSYRAADRLAGERIAEAAAAKQGVA
ncbi:MAG: leucine dehydrogenase [Gemmatimonadales bacterium]|nr:leucine dehydrogenase [Gemmatimonadales bacterium]NIN10823.1 leucine dehydrogenase [Gemmatimonadales bacterium]NIN49466.1 leucine dehydrogenase [Gemmatimonadales bacterium]NIP06930.1 leucine dehydrogenase [Gemmatimonadales bacterium]NIR01606.1 leucine dehydrogenase [Gemmatimonadales bacterium]